MNQRSRGELAGPASGSPEAVRFPGPTDRLLGIYALVSGAALLFPYRPGNWPVWLLLHLLVALVTLGPASVRAPSARLGTRAPRIKTFLADWYPLLLIPALYSELAPLNLAVHAGHYFDAHILAVESWIFGEPSQTWARSMPNLLLSEVLHGAYISYYLIIYGPPILLYAQGRHAAFRTSVFTIMFTFVLHYVFFIYYPVQGPRYLFPAPGGVIAEGGMYQLAHQLLEAGSSRGAAFPSSHVGVATAQVVLAFRFLPRLVPVLALLTAGLALGAVYGGFHYATDAVAGLLLGLLAAAVAMPVARRLGAPHEIDTVRT